MQSIIRAGISSKNIEITEIMGTARDVLSWVS
jgi:hypothetical protein